MGITTLLSSDIGLPQSLAVLLELFVQCSGLVIRFYWVVGACSVVTLLWYLVVTPWDRKQDLSSLGSGRLKISGKRRFRMAADQPHRVPPVYPNGWFALLESSDLPTGQAVSASALGKEFAVFRDDGGKCHVLDAFCPHMGAHLAVGGRVTGDCLECPFHGWQFRGEDGKCTAIPYSKKIPDFARVRTWPCSECNGFLFVWYHAQDDPPPWKPAAVPELQEGAWKYEGRSEHIVRCHIQEIPENGADVAHFFTLHAPSAFLGSAIGRSLRHIWSASWEPETGHTAALTLTSSTTALGRKLPFADVQLTVRQIGPALVHLYCDTWFGQGLFIQCVTPEGPLRQRVVHHLYTQQSFPRLAAKLLMWVHNIMFERDVMVWNNKIFRQQPLLVSEDKLIVRFRRWYSQFYSEDSPTLARSVDDW